MIFCVLPVASETTLVGYDIESIVSTQVYSLLPTEQCIPSKLHYQSVTRGALILHAPEIDIMLKYCLYKASYTVGLIAHSARFDDVFWITADSRPTPTYYPLNTWVCSSAWAGEDFQLPGFMERSLRLNSADFLVDGQFWEAGTEKRFRFSSNFYRGGKRAGVEWAWPTDWIDPLGNEISGNIKIEGYLILGKMNAALDKTTTPYDLTLRDHFGQIQTIAFPGADFVYDSTVYLPTFHGQCLVKLIHRFDHVNSGFLIDSGEIQYLSGEPQGTDGK